MANKHFGNLADVYKHVALCEALAAVRPAEYWESHAGAATYAETGEVPAERAHGVHQFAQLAEGNDDLRLSIYGKILRAAMSAKPSVIPGSPLLARWVLGDNPRRMLLCDTDADTLQNVRQTLSVPGIAGRGIPDDKLECIPDDGVSVLRGAGVLLPEQWGSATLALIDPYELDVPTAAGISPLELACELGNRAIRVLLFYAFADAAARGVQQERARAALERARLLNRGACRFEGALAAEPGAGAATQWGFGLLALNLPAVAADAMDQKLRVLQQAYAKGDTFGGAWAWSHARAAL